MGYASNYILQLAVSEEERRILCHGADDWRWKALSLDNKFREHQVRLDHDSRDKDLAHLHSSMSLPSSLWDH